MTEMVKKVINRLFCIYFIAILLTGCDKENGSELPGQWEEVSGIIFPSLTGRRGAACFGAGDTTYYGLGSGSAALQFYFNDMLMYTPKGWMDCPDFPGRERVNATGFVLHGNMYVGLGFDCKTELEFYRDMWKYDPVRRSWDSLAYEYSGVERRRGVSFSLAGKGYFGTGWNGESLITLGDFYEFDPQSGWREIPGMKVEKQESAVAFVADGAAYLCFGQNGKKAERGLWKFVPGEEKWTLVGSFQPGYYENALRKNTVAFVLKGEKGDMAYFVGGTGDEGSKSFWGCCCYNPRQDKWEEINEPGVYMNDAVVFTQGNKALVWDQREKGWSFMP